VLPGAKSSKRANDLGWTFVKSGEAGVDGVVEKIGRIQLGKNGGGVRIVTSGITGRRHRWPAPKEENAPLFASSPRRGLTKPRKPSRGPVQFDTPQTSRTEKIAATRGREQLGGMKAAELAKWSGFSEGIILDT
jgi:hypothetical protein